MSSFVSRRPRGQGDKEGAARRGPPRARGVARGYLGSQDRPGRGGEEELEQDEMPDAGPGFDPDQARPK